MDDTVDILCVIDAEKLASYLQNETISKGSSDDPTSLGAWGSSDLYIYMITSGCFVVNNQAKSELTIVTRVGDNVRWGITNPSNRYSCMLYNFDTGQGKNLLSKMELLPLDTIEYINDPLNQGTPKKISYTDSVWQTTVLSTGTVQYTWSFQLIDNETGSVLGYFSWDPFININDN